MKYINYVLVLIGAVIAIYSRAGIEQNIYILILGICTLMIGVYRISKTIPDRNNDENIEEN